MHLWRIEKAIYAPTANLGIGAFTVGGRWTSAGRHAVYASANISLAMLEILVHAPTPATRKVPRVLFRIEIDDALVEPIDFRNIPRPFIPSIPVEESQPFGDAWLKTQASVALIVPSVIINLENNVILNPAHPDYAKVKWSKPVKIDLDERLDTSGVSFPAT